MALEYRVMSWGDEVATERVALWEDVERLAATTAGRTLDIVGTDESVDRHNTKILVDGWQLDDYRNNPVLLWSHNQDPAVSTMPIGRIVGIYKETYARAADASAPAKVGKRLVFRAEFPEEGIYPFADLVHKMYAGKFLRASSVGFRNLKLRRLDPSDEDDQKQIEADGFDAKHPFGAAILEKNALMELSAVPVGSNPNALAKALREATPEAYRGLVVGAEAQIDDAWIAERFELLRSALAPTTEDEEAILAETSDDVAEDEARFVKKVGAKYCVFSKGGKQIACHPTKEKAVAQLQAIEASKHAKDKTVPALSINVGEQVDALMRAHLDEVKKFFKAELETLRAAISYLTDRVADLGDAERVAGEEPEAPAPADPLEVLLNGENEETLRRISSLLK